MFKACVTSLLLTLSPGITMAAEETPLILEKALADHLAQATFTGNGRDSATMVLTNKTGEKRTVQIPAGLVFAGANGERQLVLRALDASLTPNEELTAILPTAALSSKNTDTQRPLSAAPAEAKLAPLVALFAKQADLPRPTAQLAVFIALENITLPAWQKWLSREGEIKAPTPAEIAQIVDALGLVRLSLPDIKPTLLADENFKRLALRNPWARGKAMAIYGLSVDDAVTGDPSLPPDLGTLLHSKPGDNCPICRQRTEMQKGNGL